VTVVVLCPVRDGWIAICVGWGKGGNSSWMVAKDARCKCEWPWPSCCFFPFRLIPEPHFHFDFSGFLSLPLFKLPSTGARSGCFPGLLKLRYQLESDKPKASATSIQSDNELKFFINRMRGLIVPQRLPSGKISSRVLKPVLVYFEDAGEEKEVMVTNKSTTSSIY
jgi:hypothetical protein